MEPELNEVDIHCIKHYGYNTVGDVNALRAKQDKDHLIIEEFEYRIAGLEEQIEKLNYIKRNFDYCVAVEKKKLEDKIKAILEEYRQMLGAAMQDPLGVQRAETCREIIIVFEALLEKENNNGT